MTEETLIELVMNLISLVGELHEKNLKYEAQNTALKKEKAVIQARLSAYENGDSLDSMPAATGQEMVIDQQQLHLHHQQQNRPQTQPQTQIPNQSQPLSQPCVLLQQQQQQQQPPLHHHHQPQQHHSQVVYQPMAASQSFMTQPHQYIWTGYDPTTSGVISAGQVPYYEQYASSAQAFAQQQQ